MTTIYDRCPAATGVPVDTGDFCSNNPDGAHRCRCPVSHIRFREGAPSPLPLPADARTADHFCDCGFMWTSGPIVQKQTQDLNRARADRSTLGGPDARADEFRMPITLRLAADFATSPAALSRMPALPLTLGDNDLGQWVIIDLETRFSPLHGNHYIATMLRKAAP